MANPDKARGFIPVQNTSGGSWNASLAVLALPDDAEEEADGWFIGMPCILADEENSTEAHAAGLPLVAPLDDEHDETADVAFGVIVGIGRPGDTGSLSNDFGAFNPVTNEQTYATPAEVEADTDGIILYCCPAKDWIFEVQIEAADDEVTVGMGANVTVANSETATELGNVTTGIATAYEIVATETHPQLTVVGFPSFPDNDPEIASASAYVMFANPFLTGHRAQGAAVGGAGTE